MNNEDAIGCLTFEDGTKYNPIENPLAAKWAKLYPESRRPELSQVCDGYSCAWCGRCPQGENWKLPEEDHKEYLAYCRERDKDLQEQQRVHGQLMIMMSI